MAARIRADRFNAIKYEAFHGPRGTGVGKRLGSPWVFQWIFKRAWAHFSKNIATTDWSKKQTAKLLYNDPEDWGAMKHGVRHAIGRCLRYFVNQGMLPLYVVNPKSKGTKFYALINK